jgi:ribose transport system ATP-binding protein
VKKEAMRLRNICYNENSIEIVRDGSFHVFEGEIVGLVGKNHAGKSTLLGAATGEFPAQSGDIWIQEHRRTIFSIEQARKEGIFLIKAAGSLIDKFSIKDTMKLNFAFVGKKQRYGEYIKKCKSILETLNVTEDSDTLIEHLNFHKRVLVEMAQALICDAKILVLDNVVSLLSSTAREEIKREFQLLRMRGISVILIENEADCILPYIGRLCVMRKGRVVAELSREEMEQDLILSLIEGEKFIPRAGEFRRLDNVDYSRKMLEFSHIYTEDRVIRDLSFSLYTNETLGLWNRNRHSGKAILDVLGGRSSLISGVILSEGRPLAEPLKHVSRQGILLVPEDDEIFTNMNLGENISLSALRRNAYGGVVKKEGELLYLVHNLCSEYFRDEGYRLFPSQVITDNALIKKKVALCRAVACGAKVIVYNNPCLKMDVREKELFTQDILKTQKKKIAQLVISAHLDSLYPFCNRILQIEEGRIVGEISLGEAQESVSTVPPDNIFH